MRGGFRNRLFFATFGIAAAVLLLSSALVAVSLRRQTLERIQSELVHEARLAAELLARSNVTSTTGLQDEARALGRDSRARVTLIADDGHVIGDSSQDEAGLAQLENQGSRPEVIDARERGIGIESRFSATLGIDMLYVAVPVRHPAIAFVRFALPLTEIDGQFRTIWRATLYALALSGVGAFALAWIASALLVRRLSRLAIGARRYAAGDVPAPPPDYEDDEIGSVAKVLDETVGRLGERAADLARDRARMEAILAGMVEGVLVIDAGERVQLVNAAASRMLALDETPVGRHYLESVRHPSVVAQVQAARTGRPGVDVEPVVIREGTRAILARAAPVQGMEGRGAVLVLHDVTDLQRADQIRRDFVANVSHELRTPLTAIRGYIEALRDDTVEADDRTQFVDVIARHTSRMERLTKDLLRLASLDAGQEPPEYAPCDMRDVFKGVMADLQPQLDAKRQRIDVDVEPAMGLVLADRSQLHDALHNLLENASIYSPEASTITLTASTEGRDLVLTVADRGPGIPATDLSRVFERFYRVDKARARDSGGTGLGLAIVKHLVERMDGSVRATNREGGGAQFVVRLPQRRV